MPSTPSPQAAVAESADTADELVVVAAGEGGPEQLLQLFRGMPAPRRPILIVQRSLPLGFTPYLADMIAQAVGCPCREAIDREHLATGVIFLVPAGFHAEVVRIAGRLCVKLKAGERAGGACPAIDPVLQSAAQTGALVVTAILLTGRGRDGCDGARAVLATRGRVLVQDPQSAPYPELARHLLKFVPGVESASQLAMRAEVCAAAPVGRRAPALAAPDPPPKWSQIVVVAASTGGPAALLEFLDALPPEFADPVLIVQHIPPGFSMRLAESLSAATGRRVELVSNLGPRELAPSQILLAPGNHHLKVIHALEKVLVCLDDGPPIGGNRPAADVLFRSAAEAVGSQVTAVVLTGTGRDGLIGSSAVSQAGGRIMAQDLRSATAKGMPQAVIDAKLADVIATPANLAALLSTLRRHPTPGANPPHFQ